MQQCWLVVAEFGSNVSCHAEVRVLINSARNQTRQFSVAKDERETGGERRRSLYCRETDLADAVAVAETEDALYLVKGHTLLDANHVAIKSWTLPETQVT